MLVSCGVSSKAAVDTYSPEESSLNVMKITDESSTSVLGPTVYATMYKGAFASSIYAGNRKSNYHWGTGQFLSVSPDGEEIAFLGRVNKQQNILVKKASLQGASTQRTFRNVSSFSWGSDDNLYYRDYTDGTRAQIASTNAHQGSLVRQLTNNNDDTHPALSKDGKILFFTRTDNSGPSIWSLNLETGALTTCARGYNPAIFGDDNDKFLCVRNSTAGNSEIWLVDYMKGQETLILSDKETGYSNPSLSPDGKWILCVGNSKSNITRKQNLNLFVVKVDGTECIQLTYHMGADCCPVWSPDGKYIYFLSTRGNKKDVYNVWRIRFAL